MDPSSVEKNAQLPYDITPPVVGEKGLAHAPVGAPPAAAALPTGQIVHHTVVHHGMSSPFRGGQDLSAGYFAEVGSGPQFPGHYDFDPNEHSSVNYYIKTNSGVHRISINRVRMYGLSPIYVSFDGILIASRMQQLSWVVHSHPKLSEAVRLKRDYCVGTAMIIFSFEGHAFELYLGHPRPLASFFYQLTTIWKPLVFLAVDGVDVVSGKAAAQWRPWLHCGLLTILFPLLYVFLVFLIFLLPVLYCMMCAAKPVLEHHFYDGLARRPMDGPVPAGRAQIPATHASVTQPLLSAPQTV